MQIVCPNCSTSYQVATPALGESGRHVRCARCKTVWLASAAALEMADTAPAEGSAAEPENTTDNDLPADDAMSPAETGAASEIDNTDAQTDETLPVMADAPPLAPGEADATTIENGPENVHEDIETIAARREAERWRFRLRVPLPVVIVVLGALSTSLIGFRKDVVRHAPQLASFYAAIGLPVNLRGLVFADVKTADETRDGVPMLVVEGTIASTAAAPVDVPRLRFALRNAAGTEVYAWTAMPSQPVLAPGEHLSFRSRLASPPADGRDLEVRFFTQRDVAGH
jgi:predicted Zn finger-like uncharacterized protein